MKTGVLISGRGSNMAALVEACAQEDFPAEIALVASNNADAAGLDLARDAGLATAVVDHRSYSDRQTFEEALTHTLDQHDVEFVCLAGFMRLLTEWFVNRWHNRLINIHPSLLPAFKGLETHERVLEAGVRFTGCTVHFVRAEMDDGPIIAQAVVPVVQSETTEALAARVLTAEHRLYPHALALIASGNAKVEEEKVLIKNETVPDEVLVSPAR